MRRSRGVLLALVVCAMVLAACDLFQAEEPAMATAAPAMADRETATPVGTEELFFGEVSGFTPPPPMGGGGSIAPATTRQAGDGDDTSVQEPNPTLVSRYHGPWSPEERIVESDTIARARLQVCIRRGCVLT